MVASLSLQVPLNSLISKASAQALAEVPSFGVRKQSSSNLFFSELIGESPPPRTRTSNSASRNFASVSPPDSTPTSLPETLFGGQRYNSRLINTDGIRVENIIGKAILHIEPATARERPRAGSSDIFDSLLGLDTSPPKRAAPVPSSSGEVKIRLEYDDTTIASEAAVDYLARLQHHLEYPSQLVI
jgi:hypothetical protein